MNTETEKLLAVFNSIMALWNVPQAVSDKILENNQSDLRAIVAVSCKLVEVLHCPYFCGCPDSVMTAKDSEEESLSPIEEIANDECGLDRAWSIVEELNIQAADSQAKDW
jgi:hypothetical protein